MKNKANRYNSQAVNDIDELTDYIKLLLKSKKQYPMQILLDIDTNNNITINWNTMPDRSFEFVDVDQQVMTTIQYPNGIKEYCTEEEFDDRILSYIKEHPEYTIDSAGNWVYKSTFWAMEYRPSEFNAITGQIAPIDIKAEGTMEAQPADKVYKALLEEGVEYVNTPDGPKKLSDIVKEKTTE